MAKDFSDFLGPKKKKNINLLGNQKTENKVSTNRVQTENKVSTSPTANRVQTENKVSTGSDGISKTEYKVGTQPSTLSSTNRVQTENKVSTNCDFSSLLGLQRKLLILIYFSVRKTQSSASEQLSVEYLARSAESTRNSVRQSIQRLEKKGFVLRESFKNGRGGWTKYSIPKSVFQDLLRCETENKVSTNWVQTENKVSTQPSTQLGTRVSSSSREINLETTITNEEMWKTLNLSVVEKMGINQSAIFEARQKFGPFSFVDFESLIDRFSKYIVEPKNGRRVSNPRAFFFGLCKQMQAGIEPLSEVETETDKAMKEYLLVAKAEQSERQRQNEEVFGFAFEKWFDSLGDEEKSDMVPQTGLVKAGSPPYRALFKDYFEKNLWADTKQAILKGENIAGNP